ncbi:MAG: DUF3137 domain-containing protein [Hyphomonadaceae bacterium]
MAKKERVALATIDEAMAGLPDEFGFFRDRFREHVEPDLLGLEEERVKAARRQINFSIIGVVVGVALAVGAFFLLEEPWQFFGAFAGVIVAFGIIAWGGLALKEVGNRTKKLLIDPVAHEFGMEFELAPSEPPAINQFRTLGLISRWDRAKYEDRLTGTRGVAPFEFFEAHLEERRQTTDSKGRSKTEWVTVFKGQCLVAHFPKPFEGVTKVFRDAGMFNAFLKMGAKEPRVRLEDPKFEKAFEVFGSDQVEARYILTPDFMERMLQLEKVFLGKRLRCGFSGGEMFLCVEGKNLFEPGNMHKPMHDFGRVREMLQDFAAMFLLIDSMSQRRTPEALRNQPQT